MMRLSSAIAWQGSISRVGRIAMFFFAYAIVSVCSARNFYTYKVNNNPCKIEDVVKIINYEDEHPDDFTNSAIAAEVMRCPPKLNTPPIVVTGQTGDKKPKTVFTEDSNVVGLPVGTMVSIANTLQFNGSAKVTFVGGVMDGGGKNPLFRIGGDAYVAFEETTLQNGRNKVGSGGILIIDGTKARVVLLASTVQNGRAIAGGLIDNSGELFIVYSILKNGRAMNEDGSNGPNNVGGLIWNKNTIFSITEGDLIWDGPFDPAGWDKDEAMRDSNYYNQFLNGGATQGGAVYNSEGGFFAGRNMHFENNFVGSFKPTNNFGLANVGGADIYNAGKFHASVSRFESGTSIGPGSSLFATGETLVFRSAFVNGRAFLNNQQLTTAHGGSVAIFQGRLEIEQSAFVKNTGCDAAAIYLQSAGVVKNRVANSTFDRNEAACAQVSAVVDMLDSNGVPVGPVTVMGVPFTDLLDDCTIKVTSDAYDLRVLHNTFAFNQANRADVCIDKINAQFLDFPSDPPANSPPPKSGFWIGGNLFRLIDDPLSAASACNVSRTTDKPYVYYLSNVESVPSGSTTSCQRGTMPVSGTYLETINLKPSLGGPNPYGTFGAVVYVPEDTSVNLSVVDLCADPSVRTLDQISKKAVRTFALCSAGSVEVN
jgi:hypothetical protein